MLQTANGDLRGIVVDAIPLTATGKINKRELRDRYRNQLMQPPPATTGQSVR